MKRAKEQYDAALNTDLVEAVMSLQRMRRPMQWLVAALKYTPEQFVDCLERTLRKHGRASAAAGGGRA